jgi:hypothetical protein
MRIPAVAPVVSMLGLLAVLTACGGGPQAAPAAASPTPTTAVVSAGGTTSASASTTPSAKSKNTPAAGVGDTAKSFKAELDMQRQDVAMVTLTNTSGHSVTVQGWPDLTFTNAHGDKLSVPAQKVEVPGPGPSITVVAGGSVFAPVEWTEGDKADDSTFVADGVAVTPPGGKSPVDTKFVGVDGTAPGYYEFDLKSVKIGTFQPSTHNLLQF